MLQSFPVLFVTRVMFYVFRQTTELTWMVQNPIVGSEGNYTCYANNIAGSTTRGTWLTITGNVKM